MKTEETAGRGMGRQIRERAAFLVFKQALAEGRGFLEGEGAMTQNAIDLGTFITWEHGENYPFSACMKKLMEVLGADQGLYTYGFFAGLSGDDFIMCYGNNGLYNDCVSVCEDAETFLARTFGRIGLRYELASPAQWKRDPEALKKKLQSFIDRGVPVLVKGAMGKGMNFDLAFAYEENGEVFSVTCGDPKHNQTCRLAESGSAFIFIDSLPQIEDIAQVYRESMLQIPQLMRARTAAGVDFGANAYRRWADDLENGRYESLIPEEFESWGDWCVFVCNLATNARHGADFLARAYVYNPDMPGILRFLALLDRNEDLWRELERLGTGLNVTLEALQNPDTRRKTVETIRRFIPLNQQMERELTQRRDGVN